MNDLWVHYTIYRFISFRQKFAKHTTFIKLCYVVQND